MTKKTFEQGIAKLIFAFPDKKFETQIIWEYLQDLSDLEFKKAVDEIIATQKDLYPGTNIIALIRERAKTKLRLTSAEAWGIVKNQISQIGSYGQPKFEDPIIAKAVGILGWRELCMSENQEIDRAHFFKVYDSLVEREKNSIMLPERLKKLISETKIRQK